MLEIEKIQNIASEVLKLGHEPSTKELSAILRKNPKSEGGFYSKAEIIEKYTEIAGKKNKENLTIIRKLLRMKPTRTISGVAPITIFTKPYPCPGNCIFCPTQKDMPKSYLREEPGAMRAERLAFDPYRQTQMRIQALENIGHNTDKVDIIISGGTWNHYEKEYREWYIKQVFLALNGLEENPSDKGESKGVNENENNLPKPSFVWEKLKNLHKQNETAKHRCVGITIETRPDYITEEELIHLRKLGVTKVQIGVQSLDEEILKLNKRGHTAEDSRKAINLLRLAGFKIHIHWMANLYGSNLEKDYEDFQKLFTDKSVKPDELKVYPCSVVENTELIELMKQGKHTPYSETDLINLLKRCKTNVEEYCRITRLFRDIPSQLIKGGTKKTNLRQIVQREMKKEGLVCNCIRCREIRNEKFNKDDIKLKIYEYETTVSTEYFLSFIIINNKQPTINNRLLGFLRLSLPKKNLSKNHFIEELQNSAIIREVHVYGRSLQIGKTGATQHLGLGTRLIEKAKELAKEQNYEKLSVISAIGTKGYYRKKGFEDGQLYQHQILKTKGV